MTGGEIESMLYTRVKAMNPPISGSVYYDGYRPIQKDAKKAKKEDIIVRVISGTSDQIQKGSCVVNVYVPNVLTSSGASMRNKSRCDELATWLEGVPTLLNVDNSVRFYKSSMILTIEDEGLGQHFVSLKMDFKLLT